MYLSWKEEEKDARMDYRSAREIVQGDRVIADRSCPYAAAACTVPPAELAKRRSESEEKFEACIPKKRDYS